MENWPIGVFVSYDTGLGLSLPLARELGIRTIQLHAPSARSRNDAEARKLAAELADAAIEVTCVFAGFEGESYADIPTVERTIGLVPPATRAERLAQLKQMADFARELDVTAVGLHLGAIPHDPANPEYARLIAAVRDACTHCQAQNQSVHLETGQETAEVLLDFLLAADCDNLFINFDPANMILYGCGEPIEALKLIGKHVRSVHCKDAKWSDRPGETWGTETPLGEGDVDFRAFLGVLRELDYQGPLTIEREIPQEPERQQAEIGHAVKLLNRLKEELGV